MKYARLKRVSESNHCSRDTVIRKTVLKVQEDGVVEAQTGRHYINPVFIGRTVELTRHVNTNAIVDVRIID